MKATEDTLQPISFGTDGIRGNADSYPFNTAGLATLGHAIAEWMNTKYGAQAHILIGHDTRSSCHRIKQTLSHIFSQQGIAVTDAGVLPTPALYNLLKRYEKFNVALVISASHNVYTDNGIKLFDRSTGKLNAIDEQAITQSCAQHMDRTIFASLSDEHTHLWHRASESYCQDIISRFDEQMLYGKHIVLDCANGATSHVAPTIFQALGAQVTTLNDNPNGQNINHECGALYPEKLAATVRQLNADMGFAFDGDGDRVVGVSKTGKILDGDDLLCILLSHKNYRNTKALVGTVMTNLGLEQFLHQDDKELVRVKVGDKYIAAHLEQENLLIGGETSGHIILKDYLATGDGIFVALRVLQACIENKSKTLPSFSKCPQVMVNVPVATKKDLTQRPFAQLITNFSEQLENGRMVVRYSGTENVLRVMAEDATYDSAHCVANTLARKLQQELE